MLEIQNNIFQSESRSCEMKNGREVNYSAYIVFFPALPECLHNEKPVIGSKVYRRKLCMSPTHRDVPKTNGHPVCLSTSITPELQLSPRLGRPLNVRSLGIPRYGLHIGFWL